MEKKKLTIFVVRNDDEPTRKVVVSTLWLKLAGGLFAATALAVLAGIVDYTGLLAQSIENKRLRVENAQLLKQFQIVEGKVTALENGLERVKTFTTKLRLITNLDQEDRSLQLAMGAAPQANASVQEYDQPMEKRPTVQEFEAGDMNEAQKSMVDEQSGELAVTAGKDYRTLAIRIDRAIQDTQLREQSVLDLWETLSERQSLLASTPNIRPAKGWYSSKFGYRVSPFTGKPSMHAGLDIAASLGSPVYAPGDAMVSYTGFDDGYGKLITLDHGYGITTRFGHLSQIYVQVGQKVSRWDVVGSVGSTGRSTSPHLHYEVRLNDVPRNPHLYILEE